MTYDFYYRCAAFADHTPKDATEERVLEETEHGELLCDDCDGPMERVKINNPHAANRRLERFSMKHGGVYMRGL